MPQIVEIVGVGPVEFPDGMSKEEMAEALKKLPMAQAGQPAQPTKPVGAYDRFLDSLRNPQTGGRSGVVGPMLVGGTGELIRGAGAVTQLAGFPNAGNRMVEVGEAMTQGAKSVAPVSGTVGQIGSYVLPFGAAQRLSGAVAQVPQVAKTIGMLPSYARSIGQQAAIGGTTGYALTPDQQGRGESAAFGAIGGAGGELIAPVARATGKTVAEALGLSTGVGGEPIRQAFRAGQTGNQQFVQNMRGQVPVTDLLEQAQSAMQTLKQNRMAAYQQGIQSTQKNPVFLDFKPIENKFNSAIQNLTVKGVGGVTASRVGQKTLDDVAQIKAVIDEWKAKPELHTTEGLDALKRRIDDVYSNDMSNAAKSILTQTRATVKNTIVKQDPNYAKTMRDYEDALSLERELEKALSLGDKSSIDTALRKLQSLGRDNVNTSYAYRKDLADILRQETGVDLMPAVAGQSLNTLTPRGIQRLLPTITTTGGLTGAAVAGPAAAIPLATLPLQSPRLVGEAVYGAGQASRPFLNLANSGTPEQRQLAKLLIMKAAERGASNE